MTSNAIPKKLKTNPNPYLNTERNLETQLQSDYSSNLFNQIQKNIENDITHPYQQYAQLRYSSRRGSQKLGYRQSNISNTEEGEPVDNLRWYWIMKERRKQKQLRDIQNKEINKTRKIYNCEAHGKKFAYARDSCYFFLRDNSFRMNMVWITTHKAFEPIMIVIILLNTVLLCF